MSRRGRWALALVAALLAALVAGVVWFVRNPMRAFEIGSRRRLEKAGFERFDLGAGQARVVRFVAGSGPALLLLHGLGDQAGTWSSVAPDLARRHRVWVPDLPGHGESPPLEGDLPMATIVAGAERLVEEAAAEGPVVIVGNSLGAWLATIAARRSPERVARIVLVDGGPLRGEPGAPSLLPADRREAARLMSLLRDPSSPRIPGFVLDDVVRRAARGPISRLSRDLDGLEAHLLDGRLGEITTPVDLLWGASDRVVPPAYAERMTAELPAARLTLVEKCGHVPQVECPERFLAALREVLAAPPPAARAEPAATGGDSVPGADP